VDCFYVGGTNYADIVRRCETNGIWCIWGSALDTANEFPGCVKEMTEAQENAFRGVGYWLGPLVPTNPSPAFVYQVSFPEMWNQKREETPEWAEEFRKYLKGRFGSLNGLNEALGTTFVGWGEINFSAALKNSSLKYESFRFRMRENLKKSRPVQKRLEKRFGLPRSTHFSSYYNLDGQDPLVTLADFEALWEMFDIVGFDGGFGLESAEFAIDFAKGGIELDMARSFYPEKPVGNNENHVIIDGIYRDYDEKAIYLTNILSYLLGQNAGSIWNWANTRHTYGEYVFTRVNTCAATIRTALDLRRFPEEVAAMRRTENPPFRILHSLPSMQNESYVRSLYGIYAACSFTGWPVRFLSERDLLRGDFKGAKIVVVPDARCVSEKTFAELASFAKRGGIVIAEGEKALLGDEWGKSVPSRQADARRFRRIADSGSRTRFSALAAALDEIGARPPLALSCADGSRPYGVIWRTGRTAAGERVAFIASMNRSETALRLGGEWRELLKGRDVSGTFTLAPCEVLLLKGSRP
jgi:beta-galactosidase GanA